MNKKSNVTDSELIAQYLSGDNRSFEILLYRHKSPLFGYIYSLVNDKDLAEDFFQDTFIKAVTHIKSGSYVEQGYFFSWLCRLARNMIIDYFRRNKNIINISNDQTEVDITAGKAMEALSIQDIMVDTDIREELKYLLSLLPKEQRQILVLRFYYDMSFKDIADTLGISINTALGRARYAIMNIRKWAKQKSMLF